MTLRRSRRDFIKPFLLTLAGLTLLNLAAQSVLFRDRFAGEMEDRRESLSWAREIQVKALRSQIERAVSDIVYLSREEVLVRYLGGERPLEGILQEHYLTLFRSRRVYGRLIIRDFRQGAVLGVDEFIAKPFNIDELIARMETIVARAGSKAAARPPEPALVEGEDAWSEAEEDHSDQERGWNGVDRRRHERTAMFGAALIMMGDEPIPCVILDISGGGAALRLTEQDQQCPTLFTLEPLDGAPRHCEVRWRRGDTLGVEFV